MIAYLKTQLFQWISSWYLQAREAWGLRCCTLLSLLLRSVLAPSMASHVLIIHIDCIKFKFFPVSTRGHCQHNRYFKNVYINWTSNFGTNVFVAEQLAPWNYKLRENKLFKIGLVEQKLYDFTVVLEICQLIQGHNNPFTSKIRRQSAAL